MDKEKKKISQQNHNKIKLKRDVKMVRKLILHKMTKESNL